MTLSEKPGYIVKVNQDYLSRDIRYPYEYSYWFGDACVYPLDVAVSFADSLGGDVYEVTLTKVEK